MFYLTSWSAVCVIFLRLPLTNRAVPLLFFPVPVVVLLLKERVISRRFGAVPPGRVARTCPARRCAAGYCRARALAYAEAASFKVVADRIDIEQQPHFRPGRCVA